jgi:hypothetical protein
MSRSSSTVRVSSSLRRAISRATYISSLNAAPTCARPARQASLAEEVAAALDAIDNDAGLKEN